MKRIEAVIQPHQLDAVQKRLSALDVSGMTVSEVHGFGHQKGHTHTYRGAEYSTDFLPKLHLTIVVAEERVEAIVDGIQSAARTGKIGDGKIFITPIEDVIRIRTGEHGRNAI